MTKGTKVAQSDSYSMTKSSVLRRWFFEPSAREDGAAWAWKRLLAGWLPALLLVALVFYFSFHQVAYRWNWPAVFKYRGTLFAGWLVTIACRHWSASSFPSSRIPRSCQSLP